MRSGVITFEETIELGCRPDEVFWHMVDPETASTVDPTIIDWRCDDLPPRVGSLNRLRALGPFGITLKVVTRFTEFDPPNRMVIEGVKPFLSRWTKGVHDVAAIPDGTRYTYRIEMRPPLVLRGAHRLMARRLRRGVLEGCARLAGRFGTPHGHVPDV